MTTSEDLARMAGKQQANHEKFVQRDAQLRVEGHSIDPLAKVSTHPANRHRGLMHVCADVGGPLLCGAKSGSWVLRSMASQTAVLKPTCPDCLREMGL